MQRRCPEDTDLSVAAAFAQEQALLLPLPADNFRAPDMHL
jgi:hypothetical protein